MMQINLLTIIIASISIFGIVYLLTGDLQWGILAALAISVAGFKWIRMKRKEANDEIEYDERVNLNIKRCTIQIFSVANLLLLLYLLIAELILERQTIPVNYLIFYLGATFYIAYFIGPAIVKRK